MSVYYIQRTCPKFGVTDVGIYAYSEPPRTVYWQDEGAALAVCEILNKTSDPDNGALYSVVEF